MCNDEMDCYDYGGGSVWSCGTHGVRDWDFGTDAQWSIRSPGPPHARIEAPARKAGPGAPRGPGNP